MLDLSAYVLVFAEEFNTKSITQSGEGSKWADIRKEWRGDNAADIGFGKSSFLDAASGYDPFKVENGVLTITAVPDHTPYGVPGSWESGLIHTKASFSQTYGYFEMRADLSDSPGAWDAFWLLPMKSATAEKTGGQELDVVEHYGVDDKSVYSWIHSTIKVNNPNEDYQVASGNPQITSGYHTYGMEWGPFKISFYVDGELKGTRRTPPDMHGPMYMLANLAIENRDYATPDPKMMKIDYIRAYSKEPDAIPVEQEPVSDPDGKDPGLYGARKAPGP